MKFCQSHWDALYAAILARGLGHLISANGREAALRMKAELENPNEQYDMSNFDPLMAAHNMILNVALDHFGISILTGDYCPICEFLKVMPPPPEGYRYTTNESYFIDGPADAVLEIAKEHGIDQPLKSSEVES